MIKLIRSILTSLNFYRKLFFSQNIHFLQTGFVLVECILGVNWSTVTELCINVQPWLMALWSDLCYIWPWEWPWPWALFRTPILLPIIWGKWKDSVWLAMLVSPRLSTPVISEEEERACPPVNTGRGNLIRIQWWDTTHDLAGNWWPCGWP